MTTLNTMGFEQGLEALFSNIPTTDRLYPMRAKAWDQFQELGLPKRGNGAFQYIPLRKLYERSFVPAEPIDANLEGATLTFINGRFRPDLSATGKLPKRVVIAPLETAIGAYSAFLKNQWAQSIKAETDPFAALNAALHQKGVFLYIPPKTIMEHPIKVIHHVQGSGFYQPRIHLFVGAHSQVDISFKTVYGEDTDACVNGVIDCVVEENAHLHCIQQTPEISGWHLDAFRATLKRNSRCKVVALNTGGETVRHDYRIALTGEGAETDLSGLWNLDGTRQSHTHILIEHQAPHCRSMQEFKGVLLGNSRSSFEGKIIVRQAAQKTEAFQINHNLLLSDGAHADSKPNLEIFADDVKASHGATVGKLDPEQIFYLKGRGISQKEAEKLLVQGFCQEILDKIPQELL